MNLWFNGLLGFPNRNKEGLEALQQALMVPPSSEFMNTTFASRDPSFSLSDGIFMFGSDQRCKMDVFGDYLLTKIYGKKLICRWSSSPWSFFR